MLSAQAVCIYNDDDRSNQCWYRPTNRYPARIFGTLNSTTSAEYTQVKEFEYLVLSKERLSTFSVRPELIVESSGGGSCSELFQFVATIRGRVHAESEEMGTDDVEQDQLDLMYRQFGLRRYRRIRIARNRAGEILEVIIVQVGPLGLNFSFLENRTDIIVSPHLEEREISAVCESLMAASKPDFADYEPDRFPIVTDATTCKTLTGLGASPVRTYSQSVWLEAANIDWYRHTEMFYEWYFELERRRASRAEKTRSTDKHV